jgi:hypothetical protein
LDGIEPLPCAAQFEFEVAFADHARVQHIEFAIELRLGETLSPRPCVAQQFGVAAVDFGHVEFAIAEDFRLQQFRRQPAGGAFAERPARRP